MVKVTEVKKTLKKTVPNTSVYRSVSEGHLTHSDVNLKIPNATILSVVATIRLLNTKINVATLLEAGEKSVVCVLAKFTIALFFSLQISAYSRPYSKNEAYRGVVLSHIYKSV